MCRHIGDAAHGTVDDMVLLCVLLQNALKIAGAGYLATAAHLGWIAATGRGKNKQVRQWGCMAFCVCTLSLPGPREVTGEPSGLRHGCAVLSAHAGLVR